MKCQEFEERLQSLLDERLRPESDPALTAHSRSCVDCREILQAQQALFQTLPRTQGRPSPKWQREVARSVVAAAGPQQLTNLTRTSQGSNGHRLRWLSVALVGVAAAVVLSFSPAWRAWNNSGTDQQSVTNSNPDSDHIPTANGSQRSRKNRLAIAGPTRTIPENKTLAETNESVLPFSSAELGLAEYESAVRTWVENVELQQLEEYSPGIRPLRTTITLTFDTIRRTLPGRRYHPPAEAPAGAWWLEIRQNMT